MDDNYKSIPLFIWSRRLFWILLLIFLPTYFCVRYINESDYHDPFIRLLYAIVPVPTNLVKWEAYIMTPDQIGAYLDQDIDPRKIKKDRAIPSKNAQGNYYLLFRLNVSNRRVHGGGVKCYISGVDYPIEFSAYPGTNGQFKDHIIPIHVDPKKISSAPKIRTRWRCIWRR